MAGFYSARSETIPPLPWPNFAPPFPRAFLYGTVPFGRAFRLFGVRDRGGAFRQGRKWPRRRPMARGTSGGGAFKGCHHQPSLPFALNLAPLPMARFLVESATGRPALIRAQRSVYSTWMVSAEGFPTYLRSCSCAKSAVLPIGRQSPTRFRRATRPAHPWASARLGKPC